ncbi:hypothetical protein [Paenibacillus apiarius]|uniref:DUF4926 domain-containing protein n=1 Tax=Paenibacillus apiarius TaxID=46240 RepID=A0ABT4DZV5_9BACL|nr:hypothetical protein [Paenibacillus apiarius]MBN3524383.1 hypothetical protein [Paenibacillus apiarius]MCY9516568.1 hypothetical protein [Paenibacillus apiarius]MCY9522895.1 hypothetical protein [Paenibacillus apiarius]MCY9555254.1 hypothetical protein [Paenibacillus apiarius]MCY9560756.1 hypothetical protein [Paenibacillus apiarius]
MNNEKAVQVDQYRLVNEWQQTLPRKLEQGDKATVLPDGSNPQGLIIHIDTAGRQMYSFDFQCAYVDSREVDLQLLDVERDGVHVDERTQVIQELAQNYMRHIHECAQELHDVTHHGES